MKIADFETNLAAMNAFRCLLLSTAALFGFVLTPPVLLAQESPGIGSLPKTLDGEREMRGRITGFFTKLQSGETAAAFNDLFKGSPQSKQPEVISGFVAQTEEIMKTFGAITDNEQIDLKRVGKRLIHFTYLSYSDHYPLKWEIYCYRGKDGWQLLDFSVNKDLAGLFEASGS